MITLKWSVMPEADVESFKIYRSIVGFMAPIDPIPLNGKTLILKMNGGANQTFTFDGTPTIAKINATLTGGKAYLSQKDATQFILRSDLRDQTGSVEIVGGTALADLGLTARVITAKSEDALIDTVLVTPPSGPVDPCVGQIFEYEDEDGVLQDWYAITTVDQYGQESLKTAYRQPVTATGDLCVIEGTVMTLQGQRVPDAEVTATVQVPPEGLCTPGANVTLDTISTLSGPDGRFSLALLQGAIVKLECPRVGLSHMIKVPCKPYAFVNEIKVDLDYQYPLGYRG